MLKRLLICTDLDRTLLPNGPQPESKHARRLFKTLVEHPEITLAYVSGRDRTLVEAAITDYQLPLPDFVIGDVGTTLYHVGAEQAWQPQLAWESEIAKDWGSHDRNGLETLLQGLPDLQCQEAAKQNKYKLSFYTPLVCDPAALTKLIQQRLNAQAIKANLIWSIDEPKGVGLLDILPASASKYHAIKSLMQLKGFDISNTVFCGDSGNDIEVLASSIPAVLVANSQPDVRDRAQKLSVDGGYDEQLYIASGGYLGLNGNYSGGMLEGIAHFYPDTIKLIVTTETG